MSEILVDLLPETTEEHLREMEQRIVAEVRCNRAWDDVPIVVIAAEALFAQLAKVEGERVDGGVCGGGSGGYSIDRTPALPVDLQPQPLCAGSDAMTTNLTTCPRCGGPADQGHDRELPPTAYVCSRCQDVREALAAYAHEAWSGWMRYLFKQCCASPTCGGVTIPQWAFEHWTRQANTDYADLPEGEKRSDRKEADRMLAIMRQPPTPEQRDRLAGEIRDRVLCMGGTSWWGALRLEVDASITRDIYNRIDTAARDIADRILRGELGRE